MEASKKRVGRPKAVPQTRPLVLEEESDRVTLEVEIEAATASDLKEYVGWVELSSSLTTAEATAKTVDFALRKVFQRDGLWKEHRRGGRQPESPTVTPTKPPTPPASSAASSPSLPPPAGTAVIAAKKTAT